MIKNTEQVSRETCTNIRGEKTHMQLLILQIYKKKKKGESAAGFSFPVLDRSFYKDLIHSLQ